MRKDLEIKIQRHHGFTDAELNTIKDIFFISSALMEGEHDELIDEFFDLLEAYEHETGRDISLKS